MERHFAEYGGRKIEYELLRKNVKYINLRVNAEGRVTVSAGKRVPFSVIEAFVASKAKWLFDHVREAEERSRLRPEKELFQGKTVYFLGKAYILNLETGKAGIRTEGETIFLSAPNLEQETLRKVYLAWLRKEAAKTFPEVLERVCPLVEPYHVEKPAVTIRNMKSIWGSCTPAKKKICLNLQMMKAEESCIEQVVLHELIHFLYQNHGKEFYALLTRLMPDWKERKERLENDFRDGIG